jgi:hypothetical protein
MELVPYFSPFSDSFGGLPLFLQCLLGLGGNVAHGVPSIYNYFKREQWVAMLDELDGCEVYRSEEVKGQYPRFFQPILGRGIQFISKVSVSG